MISKPVGMLDVSFCRFFFLNLLAFRTGPGHGKGPWDGLAGTIKRTLRGLILEKELNLRNEKEVYEEIKKYFGAEKWAKDHENNKISRMNVMWLDTTDIFRPSKNSVKITKIQHRQLGIGVRSLFSYAVQNYNPVRDGSVYRGFRRYRD